MLDTADEGNRTPLLEVRTLTRAFGGCTVLEVPRLDVFPGELLALVGYSGSGKTTCLETLGLMSRPGELELKQAQIRYRLKAEDTSMVLSQQALWADESLRTWARATHLSFMFQRANLLPVLSPLDNVRLGLLLQKSSEAEARAHARQQLSDLGLNPDHEDVRTLSGGMLQRVAFGRATLPRFQLLFADEPTGNLDPVHALRVWELLKRALEQAQEPAAILVVTHDLELACRFASRVVVIGQDGYLDPAHVLDLSPPETDRALSTHRETLRKWMAQETPAELRQSARRDEAPLLPTGTGLPLVSKASRLALSSGQARLKRLLVGHPLVAPRPLQKGAFLLMLAVALLALGLAHGTREYLKVRMADPYVSWLTLDLPWEQREKTEPAEAWVRQHSSAYGIRDVRRHHPVTLKLWDLSLGDGSSAGVRLASGITLGHDEPLLQRVCELQEFGLPCQMQQLSQESLTDQALQSDPDLQPGHGTRETGTPASAEAAAPVLTPFFSSQDRGLLVTAGLLQDFGYPPDAPFLLLSGEAEPVSRTISRKIPLPIRAVVSALPEGEALAMTPFLRKQIYFNGQGPMNPDSGADLVYYLSPPLSPSAQGTLRATLTKALSTAPTPGPSARLELSDYTLSHRPGTQLQLMFESSSSLEERDALHHWLLKEGQLPKDALRLYSWTATSEALTRPDDAGLISLYMGQESLNQAPALRADLQKSLGVELDVARVEALKNYDSVALSSKLLSWSVMILGGLCAGVFITYSLYSMLLQMREFLGTLVAFGASRATLEAIFRRQLLVQLGWAFGLVLPLVWLLGWACFSGVGGQVLGLPTAPGESLFHFWNRWVLGFVGLMFVLGVISVRLTAQRLLSQDPGALIYDRLQ